uniref:Peptidoglycan deacetylase n=1 Tax=Talaromyces marneffei PM1 TaxID=1077442 RepID=A0A093USI2_TALMA
MGLLPARKAVALQISAGQAIKIINTHGKQVVDFWAFNPSDPRDFLSMVHTRTVLRKVAVRLGDSLYSTRRKPMLTIEEDTTKGVHDIIWSTCDAERYRMQGVQGYHDNCSENMHTALKTGFPDWAGIPDNWVPDPFNTFMNVAIDHHGGLDIREPTSEKGQYIVLRSNADLILVMSSCPQDIEAVNGGMPTDCEYEILDTLSKEDSKEDQVAIIPAPTKTLSTRPQRRIKVALSFDFDAVSHWLGTGCHPDNNMADYSSGVFAGQIGAIRLLNMLKKFDIADKVTWFVPGHTMETFPETVQQVVKSGAEIGLHGYAHEGIYQMTVDQERDVLEKCIEVATKLCGKAPRGYRAPMYTIRETTVEMLRKHKFLYDTSLMHHDSQPYWTPSDHQSSTLILPRTPRLGYTLLQLLHRQNLPKGNILSWRFPAVANSNGYVSTRVVEEMWKDKFLWLWENAKGEEGNSTTDFVFPILMHPDTSGMAHIIGMSERIIKWLKSWGDSVEFHKHEDIAQEWLADQK